MIGYYIRLQYITSSILIQNVSKTIFSNNSFIKIITILYFSFQFHPHIVPVDQVVGVGNQIAGTNWKKIYSHLNLVSNLNLGFVPEIPTTEIVVYQDLTLYFSVAFDNTSIALGFSRPSCIMVKVH